MIFYRDDSFAYDGIFGVFPHISPHIIVDVILSLTFTGFLCASGVSRILP